MIADRYQLERPLGHGAMAVVDLARDTALDRPVALKRLAENLARDEELRARFLREARLAGRLAHPNVVRVYDCGIDRDRPFIAMEYVDGETLSELLARRGPLPDEEVVQLGVQACSALAAAHEAGLVHRDVKPHNLLLRRDGQLKLGDFGIAVGVGGTRLTTAGTVLGTAAYLAPEQARGEEVTAAADIYSLGAVLYELLTGGPPRRAQTIAELADPETLTWPVGVRAPLAATVMHCLAADPRDRPTSAAELAHELATAAPEAATMPLPRPTKQRPRYPRWLAVGGVAAVLAGVAAAVVLATNNGSSAPPPSPRPAAVTPIPHAVDTQQQARELAVWLRAHSR